MDCRISIRKIIWILSVCLLLTGCDDSGSDSGGDVKEPDVVVQKMEADSEENGKSLDELFWNNELQGSELPDKETYKEADGQENQNSVESESQDECQDEGQENGLVNSETEDDSLSEYNNQFYISEIDDDIFARIYKCSFGEDCTVSRNDLRYIHVMYRNFDGGDSVGELICNAAIAEDLIDIFTKLYEAEYPIEKIVLVDEYGADDEKSMEDNNTSCFNFRFIGNTNTISKHGLGMAVDINPKYNPYVKERDGYLQIAPENGADYANRELSFEHKIDHEDLAYRLFREHGFSWGGDWRYSKDYQHFER